MKPVRFLSNSPKVDQIVKGLTLTKSLFVTSLIYGEPYTGKKTLVQSLFPKSTFLDGSDHRALNLAFENQTEIVIYNFDPMQSLTKYDLNNKRVIAVLDSTKIGNHLKERFAFIYHMPSLRERPEDIPLFGELFANSIQQELMIDTKKDICIEDLDLSENIKSLKASIYKQLATSDLSRQELEKLIYEYLYDKIDGNNAYREHIGLFEKPLIRAGLDRYGSQLKLSEALGLNRNTLRKKIYEHNIQ